jgi:O-antigen ligase
MILIMSIFGIFVINELVSGRSPKEALSSTYRIKQLQIGVPLLFNKPIVGYGVGEAIEVAGIYGKSIDNYYLLLALESGLPSLVFFLYLLYLIIKNGFTIYKKSDNDLGNLGGVLTVSIIGFAVFMSVLSLKQVFPIVFLTFSMILCIRGNDKDEANKILRHTIHGDNQWK